MGKSYSIDIRERVVARVEAGHSRREAAVRYDVSASFAVKLLSRRRAVLRQPGRAVRPGAASWLPIWRFWWRKWKPAVTMPELADILAAGHGVRVHPSSLSRVLCGAGFSYKKNSDGIGNRARRCQTAGLDRPASALDAA